MDIYILCIETSSINCSVALFKNNELVHFIEQGETYMHSEKLHSFIKQLMVDAKLSLNDLHAVAVSEGPGSYTGLRIGVASAKGFCYALGIPLMAISTMHVLSLAAASQMKNPDNVLFLPLVDARRMEVYVCSFDRKFNLVRPLEAVVVDEESFEEELKTGAVVFFGSGMEKLKPLYQRHEQIEFLSEIVASARFMGNLAFEKFQNKAFEDIAFFEPNYHKMVHATTPKKLL